MLGSTYHRAVLSLNRFRIEKKEKIVYDLPLSLGMLVNDVSAEVEMLGNIPLEGLGNFFILEVVSST